MGKYVLKSYLDGDNASVIFDVHSRDIFCSCKKFESWGYLCRHAIRVFDIHFILSIPDKYILARWTRDVVTCQVEDNNGQDIQENTYMDFGERYRHLCPKLVQLADYAAQSKEGYEFVLSQINGWMKAVKLKDKHVSILSPCDLETPTSYQGKNVKGLAKKVQNRKGGRRPKAWFEKPLTKKKKKDEKKEQPLTLSQIQYVKNGVVEMPSNLLWLTDDRTQDQLPHQQIPAVCSDQLQFVPHQHIHGVPEDPQL